jgi:acyl-CoA thioesterase FadM
MVRRIRSRGYELDANVTVPGSTLLRYLEHLRWESARDPKAALGQLFQDGYRMVVRAQQLEIEEHIGLEVDLDVSLELGHVGRASMEMLHEVVRVSDGKCVARGVVTAVYLNPSGRPHPIPQEVRDLSVREERTTLALPMVDEAPSDAWCRRFVVVPSDLDLFQHVNHARYLDYFDDTRKLAAADGAYGEAGEKAGGPLFRASLDYRRQAVGADAVTIFTWPLAGTGESMGFELRKDDEVLTRCRLEVRG